MSGRWRPGSFRSALDFQVFHFPSIGCADPESDSGLDFQVSHTWRCSIGCQSKRTSLSHTVVHWYNVVAHGDVNLNGQPHSTLSVYKNGRRLFFFCFDTLFRSHIRTTEYEFAHMQNGDDIQGMPVDDWDNPQVPDCIHHFRNLNYEVVYNINSFNTYNTKMRDSGNHNNNGWYLSSCRSSIVCDKARLFIRSSLTFRMSGTWTTLWPTSVSRFYSLAAGSIGPLVLYFSIFIGHSFLLYNLFCDSFEYWAFGEAYQL